MHCRITDCPEAVPTEQDTRLVHKVTKTKPTVSSLPLRRLTLLNLETARDTEVLNSSGFFCAKVVMRLVAAVTTP